MLWQVVIVAMFSAMVDCEKNSIEIMDEEEVAMVALEGSVKTDTIQVDLRFEQEFPKNYEDQKSKLKILGKRLGTAQMGEIKAYLTKTEDCSTWTMGEDDINLTDNISIEESTDELQESSGSRRKRQAEPTNTNTEVMESNDSISDEGNEIDVGDLFDLVGQNILVVDADGNKQCSKLQLKNTKGMSMLAIRFSKLIQYDKEKLIETVAKKTSLPSKAINALKWEDNDDCAVVGVYFNLNIDNEMLKKIYTVFNSTDELGIFSPTDQCMTTIDGTFISRMIMERFWKSESADYGGEKNICSNIALNGRLSDYDARVRRYDRAMDDWLDRYGRPEYRYEEDKNTKENDIYQNSDRYDETLSRKTGGGEEYPYSALNSDFKILLKFLGNEEGSELTEKRRELNRITNKGISRTADDYRNMEIILQRLRALKDEQDEVERKTRYGLCILSNKESTESFKNLKNIKERLSEASNWNEEGDKILMEEILNGLSYQLDKIADGETMLFDTETDLEKTLMTTKEKLQMIFRVNKDCSKERERNRVAMEIGYLYNSVPEMIDTVYTELEKVDGMKDFLDKMKNSFTNDFKETSDIIFTLMYAPDALADEDNFLSTFAMLDKLSDVAKIQLIQKLKEITDTASVENLMVFQILLLTNEEMENKCSLKDLAQQVENLNSEQSSDWDRTIRSYGRESGRTDGWDNYSESQKKPYSYYNTQRYRVTDRDNRRMPYVEESRRTDDRGNYIEETGRSYDTQQRNKDGYY